MYPVSFQSYAKRIPGAEDGRGKGGRATKDKRLAAITWLKEAVEDFVLESFLPQVIRTVLAC
jgi:hypothetical protein